MAATRIYLQLKPRLYSDLIQQLFKDMGQEVILSQGEAVSGAEHFVFNEQDCKEIVLLSLENLVVPLDDQFANLRPNVKILAFSPNGEFGLRRMPGEKSWEEIRPFGLAELVYEVLSEDHRVRRKTIVSHS